MINERREAGEAIDDDTWLFRNYSERVGKGFRRVPQHERGSPLTPELISEIVRKAATKAGIQVSRDNGKIVDGTPKVKYEVHSHAFRRSWKSAMRRGGVTDADLLNLMLGHELPYGGAYDKFGGDYVRSEYVKAEPFLTVMVSPEITEQIELKELEQKHASLLSSLPEETRVKYASRSPREKVAFLKAIPAKIVTKPETSKSEDKVMVIDESQISNHCNHGWHFKTVLPSGKILIERD